MLKPNKPLTPIGDDFGCKPSDIDASKHLWNGFEKCEAEVSAGYIVRLCQKLGEWAWFGKGMLDEAANEDYRFNGIDDWLIKDGDGYRVSREFVGRCLAASPAKPAAPEPAEARTD